MNNVSNIRTYSFDKEDSLFLDANVWLFLYGPVPPGDARAATYSQAFKKIRECGCKIYTDVVVFSEFINRYARIIFRQKFPDRPSEEFKKFRKSDEFKDVAQEIKISAEKILKKTSKCDSCFTETSVESLLETFEKGKLDFNDIVFMDTCSKKDFKFITDDADFRGADIDIITANKRLLS